MIRLEVAGSVIDAQVQVFRRLSPRYPRQVSELYPPARPPSQLEVLDAVMRRLAGLTVVLGHLGFPLLPAAAEGRPRVEAALPPPALPAVVAMAEHAGVHVLFGGHPTFSRRPYPCADLDVTAGRLLHAYGPGRLLWGSDFPWTCADPGYARMAELLDLQLPGLAADERAAILGATAARLFGM
jgi:L-fuconolactonase